MRKIFFVSLLSILISAQPSFAAPRASFASVEKLFLEGKYAAVISEADSLIKRGSGRKDEVYYMKGLSQLKTKDFSGARVSFNYIASKCEWSKKYFDAYLGIGDSYLLEGDIAKALGAYSDMEVKFESDKNIAIVHSRMAQCYDKMGLREKADRYSELSRRSAPMSFEAKTVQPLGQYKPLPAKSGAQAQESIHITDAKVTQGSIVSTEKSGEYSIQVGSFRDKRNADRLAKKLASSGYESYVEIPVNSGDDRLYRVKVGKFSSKEEASKLAAKMRSDGYRTKTCTGDVCE